VICTGIPVSGVMELATPSGSEATAQRVISLLALQPAIERRAALRPIEGHRLETS
jgi:hypothetical protein